MKDNKEMEVVENFELIEEIEEVVTPAIFGTIGCCLD